MTIDILIENTQKAIENSNVLLGGKYAESKAAIKAIFEYFSEYGPTEEMLIGIEAGLKKPRMRVNHTITDQRMERNLIIALAMKALLVQTENSLLGLFKFKVGRRVKPSTEGIKANIFTKTRYFQGGIVVKVDNLNYPTVLWDNKKTAVQYHPRFITLERE